MFKTIIARTIILKASCNIARKSSTQASKLPRKYFSGIQPTGAIHLGNYLGAVKQWVKLQEENGNVTLSIVDLHSMTLPYDKKEMCKNVLEMTATLLACGIDPKKTILFQQSTNPHHTELYWFLSCLSTMARLNHLPQFKEKSANLKDIPLGLYIYPVLQAADILAHKATHVPVGEDQLQHLQLAQDLARMFNSRYGNVFPIPRSVITETAKVRSLRDPSKKMSKSDPNTKSCIYLTDNKDDIVKKFKKALTDFTSEVTYDPVNRPGVANLITIHSAVSQKSPETICQEVKNLTTGEYKFVVADAVEETVAPIRQAFQEYVRYPEDLVNILEDGRDRSLEITEKTLSEVRYNLGIRFNIKSVRKLLKLSM